MVRTKTGIDKLDDFLGGGFPANRIVLLTGEPGTCKTIFASQFLYYGAKKFNEPGIYVTTDLSPDRYRDDIRRMGWDLKELESSKKLLVMDAYSSRAERVSSEKFFVASFDIRSLTEQIYEAVERINAKRIVIDSLVPLGLIYENPTDLRNHMMKLFSFLSDSLECTTLVISEANNKNVSICRFGIEDFLSDGVIFMDFPLADNKYVRKMHIKKMRGTDHSEIPLYFTIEKGQGITNLSPTTMV